MYIKDITVGGEVEYKPYLADPTLGVTAQVVSATLLKDGIKPKISYKVVKTSGRRTIGDVSSQIITVMVEGKPVEVDSKFFAEGSFAPN